MHMNLPDEPSICASVASRYLNGIAVHLSVRDWYWSHCLHSNQYLAYLDVNNCKLIVAQAMIPEQNLVLG